MLKIGVVGVGHFGRYHLNCLRSSDKYNLVGFYDINPAVCETIQNQYKNNIKKNNTNTIQTHIHKHTKHYTKSYTNHTKNYTHTVRKPYKNHTKP